MNRWNNPLGINDFFLIVYKHSRNLILQVNKARQNINVSEATKRNNECYENQSKSFVVCHE